MFKRTTSTPPPVYATRTHSAAGVRVESPREYARYRAGKREGFRTGLGLGVFCGMMIAATLLAVFR